MIKATDRKLVVGLEIGTAKVAALVGEVLPDGMINIIGVGSCPSRGMDKGGVNDLESVVKCVQRAIDQAELMADCQISSVYLALSGKHISCQNEIGMVPISEEEVTLDDVENVVHTAKSVRVRDEHRVLHVIPQEYAIDYQEGIKNPVGLSGVRMQAKVHLITCHNDMAKNIVKAVERCGLKVDQLIFAGLAASYSVLTEDERELGVCVVDIGGGTMDIAVYTGGALRHAGHARERRAEQIEQRAVVLRRLRVGDEHVAHEGAQRVHGFTVVFVHVDQHVAGLEGAQGVEVDVLGAADLGHGAQGFARMHAEAGAPDHALAQAEVEHQLGERGHQRHDARIGAGRHMPPPDGVGRCPNHIL